MNTRILLFLLFLVLSCCHPNKDVASDRLAISIDTVLIDSGDEILDLRRQLRLSDLSLDRNLLYNLSEFDNSLEKIDLTQKRLTAKLPFESEGPNGWGGGFFSFQILDDESIFVSNLFYAGEFSMDGNKERSYRLTDHDMEGHTVKDSEYLVSHIRMPSQPGVIFAVALDWKEATYSLRKLDYNTMHATAYTIDPEMKLNKYTLRIPDPKSYMTVWPLIYLSWENGKMVVSTELSNQVFIYNPTTDELESIKPKSELTESEKTGDYPNQFESEEELAHVYRKLKEQVNFLRPVWDDIKERYYRFSYTTKFERDDDDYIARNTVFLTIYDKNFNMIAESLIPELEKSPERYFVSDGKIWVFENLDDEMGFIRLSFDNYP